MHLHSCISLLHEFRISIFFFFFIHSIPIIYKKKYWTLHLKCSNKKIIYMYFNVKSLIYFYLFPFAFITTALNKLHTRLPLYNTLAPFHNSFFQNVSRLFINLFNSFLHRQTVWTYRPGNRQLRRVAPQNKTRKRRKKI